MTGIRTRDEALASIDRALARWAPAADSALTQAMAASVRAQTSADAEVSRRSARVAALEALLASLRSDDAQCAGVVRDLTKARQSYQAGVRAARQLADVAARLARLQRSLAWDTETLVNAARADLARRGAALEVYRAAATERMTGAVGVGRPIGGLAPGATTPPGSGAAVAASASSWLAWCGMADFDVAEADFTDDAITGTWGRGSLTRADYRWAVTTWDQVVRPGLDRGLTRDDFAARDRARGARPTRRTADVYDWFLGRDKIRVDRRLDGTLDVINGRHRIEVARELGITTLPAAETGA